jgi:hypothetical protein
MRRGVEVPTEAAENVWRSPQFLQRQSAFQYATSSQARDRNLPRSRPNKAIRLGTALALYLWVIKTTLTKTIASIDTRIAVVRGEKVLLDEDLANVYGVLTGQLNQAVKRNLARFPADFVFQLLPTEWASLKSQIVISNERRGGRRTPPWAYTEHGAIMAAMVLKSPRAVQMSVFVVRAFAKLRQLAATHAALSDKLSELEQRVTKHDDELRQVVAAIRALLMPPKKPTRSIGF